MAFSIRVLGDKKVSLSPFVVITCNGSDISEQLATDQEIEYRIARLKEQLDAIGKTAKAALRDAN